MDHSLYFPPRRLGILLGGAILAIGGLLAAGLAIWTFSTPPTSQTALWIGLLLLLGMLLGWVGWSVVGLWYARYTLDANTLTIHWGITRHDIPLAQIVRIVPGATRASIRVRGLWLPGNWVGVGNDAELGRVNFFATTQPALQLYVVSENGVFAISPADLRGFLDEFAQYRAVDGAVQSETPQSIAEPPPSEAALPSAKTSEQAARSLQSPAWLLWLNRQRQPMLLLAPPLIFTVFLFGLVAVLQLRLPPQLPLHFDQLGQPDRWSSPANLFILPIIALLTWFANGLLGLGLHTQARYRPNAYVLWGASWFVQALLWAGVIYIAQVAQH
jgi:hypothetical protein